MSTKPTCAGPPSTCCSPSSPYHSTSPICQSRSFCRGPSATTRQPTSTTSGQGQSIFWSTHCRYLHKIKNRKLVFAPVSRHISVDVVYRLRTRRLTRRCCWAACCSWFKIRPHWRRLSSVRVTDIRRTPPETRDTFSMQVASYHLVFIRHLFCCFYYLFLFCFSLGHPELV